MKRKISEKDNLSDFVIDYSKMEKIGRKDAEGNLILPSDEYYAGDDGLYD